jgi:hypothetical protein
VAEGVDVLEDAGGILDGGLGIDVVRSGGVEGARERRSGMRAEVEVWFGGRPSDEAWCQRSDIHDPIELVKSENINLYGVWVLTCLAGDKAIVGAGVVGLGFL